MTEPPDNFLSMLRAELTALELRIVDRLSASLAAKADAVHVEQLEQRVNSLELSRASRETLPNTLLEMQREIGELKRFRYAVPSTALLSLLVALATFLYLYLS